MSKRPVFSEQDFEDIYQGEKLLYESMRQAISFMPTMSWEEHCEFTGRFRKRIEKERAAAVEADRREQPPQGQQGKSLKAKSKSRAHR